LFFWVWAWEKRTAFAQENDGLNRLSGDGPRKQKKMKQSAEKTGGRFYNLPGGKEQRELGSSQGKWISYGHQGKTEQKEKETPGSLFTEKERVG